MGIKNYAERNREAWNRITPIHQQHRKTDLQEAIKSNTFSTLDNTEKSIFDRLSVKQKSVAQLGCNNGRELISVIRSGAASGVGFDISDEAIKEAILLGSLSGTNCDFVRTNIYDIETSYYNQFDIVYITLGVLDWFDDLPRFFQIVSQLLKENGYLFIYESHPFLDMIALPQEDAYNAQDELKLVYPYFKPELFLDPNSPDYIGDTQYEAKTTYCFPHTFSTIFSSIIENSLTLMEFKEYAHDIAADFKHLEKYQMLPMCYTIVAQKQA